MMQVHDVDEVIRICKSSEGFFFKVVAANDAGRTGSHQAGFYMPKHSWSLFLSEPGRRGENTEQWIDVLWPDGIVRRSRFIWYGAKTRSEYRLTRGFKFLSPSDAGRLFVFARYSGQEYRGFLLDAGAQTSQFLHGLSLTMDDQYAIHTVPPVGSGTMVEQTEPQAPSGTVSRELYQELLDAAIDAALAAIEVYNKPQFRYREQVFAILIVNAWELLLKAKAVHDAGNDVSSIYIPLPDGTFKMNRSGAPLTVDIGSLLRTLGLPDAVCDNIEHLVGLRDTAIHFYHEDREALRYLLFGLGAATLRNFEKLVRAWFGRGLNDYDFYILPLGFSYSFQTLSVLAVTKTGVIASIIESVRKGVENFEKETGFDFLCEVKMTLVSAKKVTGETDIVAKVDPDGSYEAVVVEKLQRPIDRYQLSYSELVAKVKLHRPGMKLQQLNDIINQYQIKGDDRYASYHFRTKRQEQLYQKSGELPKGITCIYNEDAVRFICEHLPE